MKVSITRKISLAKYGSQYETIDLGVEEAETWEEAEIAINTERTRIHEALLGNARERLEELNNKQLLTATEEVEREKLKKATNILPF